MTHKPVKFKSLPNSLVLLQIKFNGLSLNYNLRTTTPNDTSNNQIKQLSIFTLTLIKF